MKGLLALDIDGTITDRLHILDPEVVRYFNSLHLAGWHFAFITGRTFQWGCGTLSALGFPYILAVQNGALTVQMPERRELNRHYLTGNVLPLLDAVFKPLETDYAIYSGYHDNDLCYYRPARFSGAWLDYVKERAAALHEQWVAVDDFHSLEGKQFASIKTFSWHREAQGISASLEEAGLHAPVNTDPFNNAVAVVQGTSRSADKAAVVNDLRQHFGGDILVIAAGDDENDTGLLRAADIKIAMKNAPETLKAIADIIAPPAAELGIVQGLRQALEGL